MTPHEIKALRASDVVQAIGDYIWDGTRDLLDPLGLCRDCPTIYTRNEPPAVEHNHRDGCALKDDESLLRAALRYIDAPT